MKEYRKLRNLLCITICLILMLPNLTFGSSITDIKGHWAESLILEWANKGYIKSYGDGIFKPDNPITRAEFMAIVNRSFGFTDMELSMTFKDIKKTDWFYEDVAKAVKAGYMSSYGNNTIMPCSNITNQEVAVVISRLLNLSTPSGYDLSLKFKDASDIPGWSADAIKAVVRRGYMKGYNDETYKPAEPITRAEAVAVLDSCYLEHIKKSFYQSGTYSEGTIEGSILIGCKDVTLKDTIVNGDIILSEEIGDGNVHLKNVTVKGETIVKGGGMNSIYIEDSNLTNIVIIKADNKVRVVATGSSKIDYVIMQSGAKLEEQGLTGAGFCYIIIDEEVAENASIILVGCFQNVQIMADKVDLSLIGGNIANLKITELGGASNINIAAGSSVSNMTLNAPVSITGKGTIIIAYVNISGTVTEISPTITEESQGVSLIISGKVQMDNSKKTGGDKSDGDGSNKDKTPPEITKVTVLDSTKLEVEFSEAVNKATAENIANYYISDIHNKGNAIRAIQRTADKKRVELIIREIEYSKIHITVDNVADLKGNIMSKYSGYVNFDSIKDITPPIIYKIEAKADNELRIAFNERIEALKGASIVISYGNPKVYADLIWVGNTVIDGSTTMIFKTNKVKSENDSYDTGSMSHTPFTGEEFLMNGGTSYRVEGVHGVRDLAGNVYFSSNDAILTFNGVNAANDRPYVEYTEQYDEKRIIVGFSEPVLVPEKLITSKDGTSSAFNVKKLPLTSTDSYNYLRMELEISVGNLIKGQTYEFDFSSLEGLTDYCGTTVMDASDTEGDYSKYTSIGIGLDDDQGPSINWVSAMNTRRICIEYDEEVQDSLPTYKIVDSSGVQQGPILNGYRDQYIYEYIYITLTSDLLPNHAYWLKPVSPAKDIVGNTANEVEGLGVEFTSADAENAPDDCIDGVEIIDGKKIKVRLSTHAGDTDSISVVDSVYTGTELCEQLTVGDSIGFSGPADKVTVTTKKPLMDGRDYIVTIGGTSVGSSDLSKAVSYTFSGIVSDYIEIDENDIITFDDGDASDRVVYIICGDVRYLVVPGSPSADFDATAILGLIGSGSSYRIEVYGLEKLQDVTEDGDWVGEYGEYSATNPNGFKLGPILYAREF